MATSSKVVPEAKAALDKFKYEVANDIAVKKLFRIKFLDNLWMYEFTNVWMVVEICL